METNKATQQALLRKFLGITSKPALKFRGGVWRASVLVEIVSGVYGVVECGIGDTPGAAYRDLLSRVINRAPGRQMLEQEYAAHQWQRGGRG